MKTMTLLAGVLMCATPPVVAQRTQAGADVEGSWSGRFRTDDEGRPGRISLSRWDDDRSWQTTTDLPDEVVRELIRQAQAKDGDVRVALERDAGTILLEGRVRDTRGSGTFTFTERADYRDRMARAGFRGIDDDEVFAAAVHDVGPGRAQELQRLGFETLDFDDLMAASIFGVDTTFVQHMRALGFDDLDFDDVLAMKIHGVTPAFIREARDMGLGSLDADDLVAMRIHGVSGGWVREMAEEGFPLHDLDDALAFRIHGITPEWVRELKDEGFEDLDADDLLKIRIHGLDTILRKRRR